jgi:hypothetical protein
MFDIPPELLTASDTHLILLLTFQFITFLTVVAGLIATFVNSRKLDSAKHATNEMTKSVNGNLSALQAHVETVARENVSLKRDALDAQLKNLDSHTNGP